MKMGKRDITCYVTIPAQKLNVRKPQPRSFSKNNGCSRLNGLPKIDSMTCNKDEEKFEFVNNLVNGESMLWESLLEESQEVDEVRLVATTTD